MGHREIITKVTETMYVWDGYLTCDVVLDRQTVTLKVTVKSKCVCCVDDKTVICQVL